MNLLKYCFVLIVILIQSLPSNFVKYKSIQHEKIETLNKILENVDIWKQFENIKVRNGGTKNRTILTFNNIFYNIDNEKCKLDIDQNNIQPDIEKPDELRSSNYLYVDPSNYKGKIYLIFKFVRCRCWEQIKWFNRLLSYMTSDYDRICKEELMKQEKTMTLKIKSLLLTRIQEYKELVQVLYDYACFFKSLFLEGKDKVSDTDKFFSKLLPIINMPLPEGDYFANDLNEILNKSYTVIYTNSKNLCTYSNKIPHKDSYNKKYQQKLANVKYKKSFAEYMSSQLNLVANIIKGMFSQLPLNEKLE